MKTQGIRGNPSVSSQSPSTKASGNHPFQDVLKSKQKAPPANIQKADVPTTAQPVKQQLAELLQGNAPTRKVIETALKDNPAFRLLPKDVQKEMITQMVQQMDPMLTNRS